MSETGQDITKVISDDQQEIAYALSIGTKITTLEDLEGPLRTVFQNTCVFRIPPRKFE